MKSEKASIVRLSPPGDADERMRHDYPILQQFHSRYALGTLAAPSCLCCGRQTHPITRPIAVKHMQLPAIVICKQCKDASESARRNHPMTEAVYTIELQPAGRRNLCHSHALSMVPSGQAPLWSIFPAPPGAQCEDCAEEAAPAGILNQLATAVDAIDAEHDPFCAMVLRGKACSCGLTPAEEAGAQGTAQENGHG